MNNSYGGVKMEIHLKVAELRKNRNITQQELADAVGATDAPRIDDTL